MESIGLDSAETRNQNGTDLRTILSPPEIDKTSLNLTTRSEQSKDAAKPTFTTRTDHSVINLKSLDSSLPSVTVPLAGGTAIETGDNDSAGTRSKIINFAATAAASVAGAAVYGLGSVELKSRALTLPLAAGAGSTVEYSVKAGLEHLFLDEKDRTLNNKDLLWGGFDGLAGVAGGVAEEMARSTDSDENRQRT